jgi:hypothetical protein
MSKPKLHHYVPQFYLRHFADEEARLWVWEKATYKVFSSTPKTLGAETHFYRMPELVDSGENPSFLEGKFAEIEANAHTITKRWLSALPFMQTSNGSLLLEYEKEHISLFLALQFLRTAGQRDILGAFAEEYCYGRMLSDEEKANLHGHMLWHGEMVNEIAEKIADSIWIFGRNKTHNLFLTSDNPVAFRTQDNAMWLKVSVFSEGTYLVWPLSPRFVLYCKPRPAWRVVEKYDGCVSPVCFTEHMVDSENTGQVFMAKRFLFSLTNDFGGAAEFESSIGTNRYAR